MDENSLRGLFSPLSDEGWGLSRLLAVEMLTSATIYDFQLETPRTRGCARIAQHSIWNVHSQPRKKEKVNLFQLCSIKTIFIKTGREVVASGSHPNCTTPSVDEPMLRDTWENRSLLCRWIYFSLFLLFAVKIGENGPQIYLHRKIRSICSGTVLHYHGSQSFS